MSPRMREGALTCWSKQKGSDSSCKLSYAISCYKTLQIVKVYWDSKNTSTNEQNKIPQWLLKTNIPFSAQETDSCRTVSGKDQHNHACSTHLYAPAWDAIMIQGYRDVLDFGLIWCATLKLFFCIPQEFKNIMRSLTKTLWNSLL